MDGDESLKTAVPLSYEFYKQTTQLDLVNFSFGSIGTISQPAKIKD
jgi:hypothetical protein